MSTVRRLATALLLTTLAASAAWAAPKIEFAFETWDVGELDQMTERETDVKVSNVGDAPLVISNVRTGCQACTTATVPKKVLQPGESMLMHVTFNSRRFSGQIVKSVSINSNDPQAAVKQLTIIAKVKEVASPRMELVPRVLDVGVLPTGVAHRATLQVRNLGEADLVLQMLQPSKHVKAEMEGGDTVPPGQSRPLTLTIGPFGKDEAGVIRADFFRAHSNDAHPINSFVQIVGYVSDDLPTRGLAITPKGEPVAMPGGKQYYREFEIANHLSAAVKLELAVPAGAPAIKLGSKELAPGESTLLRLPDGVDPGWLVKHALKVSVEFPAVLAP